MIIMPSNPLKPLSCLNLCWFLACLISALPEAAIPESASILRMIPSRPSCLSEQEFGQVMSKLRVPGFLDVGLWANVTLMPT